MHEGKADAKGIFVITFETKPPEWEEDEIIDTTNFKNVNE